ncbi:MAG TPA: dienelactone hydrolase family protein [Planctomycetaceae bacterium]|nr:dienelactone hydrolase family protein [Planctomycetaceae bacterium]
MNTFFARRGWRPGGGRAGRTMLVAAALVVLAGSAAGQSTGFITRTYRDDAGDHRYVVFLPRDYERRGDWPVIVSLHGASERGTDVRKPLTVGLGPIVKARAATFPFVVVFPQCEDVDGRALTGWNADSADARRMLAMLDEVLNDLKVDRRRVILTGWSMGAYGTWNLAAAYPGRFHAVVPVAGGGDPADAARLKDLPVWAFHGGNDRAVPASESRKMIEALRAAGGQPRYTEVAGAGHDVWRDVYAGDVLYRWMLDPSGNVPDFPVIESAPGRQRLADLTEPPFVPALELRRAVTVRLGNDALNAIATSVPRVVRADALRGRIDDIADTTTAAGRTFNVWFTNISYNARLARAKAKSRGPEGVDLLLGVENATLTIGTTYVRGGSRSAVAGPINIVIGHRAPVWVRMIVEPRVDQGRVRLRLLNARFDIPDGNWYVTAPAGVSTRGLFMTRERVSRGLVSGLYGSKSRIEREVTSILPGVLAQVEQQIDLTEVGRLIEGFWPLPVYQPRIRVVPASVTTDAGGLTLALNALAEAVDPAQAPNVPQQIDLAARNGEMGLSTTDLAVALAPGVLSPLTQMLIDAGVTHTYVEDIPGGAFAVLADRTRLAAAVPELKRFGQDVELRSELSLAAPIEVAAATRTWEDAAAGAAASGPGAPRNESASPAAGRRGGRMQFIVPRAVISLAVRGRGETAGWQPVFDCEFRLEQQAQAVVAEPDPATRGLQVHWVDDPQIEASGRFAPGYEPQQPDFDATALAQLFGEAWTAWSRSGPATETLVQDVDLGYARLRLASADVLPGHVQLTFAEPGIEIANRTGASVVYQTQGADKPWGGPFHLEPGGTHRFDVAYPLLFRQQTGGRRDVFTLPVGSRFEFRAPAAGAAPRLFLVR